MKINHNISAMSMTNQMARNTGFVSRTMERLSSGQRINRAADDAAGLAISEGMRGQIRGLEQAQRNVQDGISLIQTAEGALNEVHGMLHRMSELAVQSANGTYSVTDRLNIQKEVDELAEQITKVANSTKFNGTTLLDGGLKSGNIDPVNFQVSDIAGGTISLEIDAMDAASLGVAGGGSSSGTTTTYTATFSGSGPLSSVSISGPVGSKIYDGSTIDFEYNSAFGVFQDVRLRSFPDDDYHSFTDLSLNTYTFGGAFQGVTVHWTPNDTSGFPTYNSITISATTSTTSSSSAAATFSGGARTADAVATGGIDVSSSASAASSATSSITKAVNTVSTQRAKLGATQNRLEFTGNNLGTLVENLTSAESRIRDADMAKEQITLVKDEILNKGIESMLVQSNSMQQNALQLLHG
ncbi:flagellin [Cohnella suwonensis]|uniref:Flagellin n=1 Tax=Cohnella suwonensis TaxID=696072 RepID=A0ABW0LWM0_9BACL